MSKYRCYFIDTNNRAVGCRIIEAMTSAGVLEQLSQRNRGHSKIEIWQESTLCHSIAHDNIANVLTRSGLPARL